jgi:hypothetical protein
MPSRTAGLSTTDRGYGSAHQSERLRLEPFVASGQADCAEIICLKPSRRISPDEPWDLAHDRLTGLHRGPAHRSCNRAEGARFVNGKRRRHWVTSRRW